jgi:preprotein translocase subunit SecF
MRRLFSNAHFEFIRLRQRAYTISAAALIVCLGGMLFNHVVTGTWLNYGVDFSGGTIVQVRFTGPADITEVRALVRESLPGAEVTRFGEENEVLIRTPQVGEATSGAAEEVPRILRERYGEAFSVERIEAVGAKVGGELQTRALLAILLSFVGTMIYLAIRFEWRFGVAAVIATAHDIILTLGLIALLRIEVALPTVAAVLTIVGYSLNDTIVIFDRIRENLATTGRREDFITTLDRSINETLPRTVLTSATTLVTLISLFLFGGTIIRPFALILIFGILLGTYSSIFVAAPALLEIEKRWPGERKKKAKPARVRTTA